MDLRDQDLAKIKTLTNLEAEMDPHETILMTILEIRPLEVVEVGEAVEAHVEEEISVKVEQSQNKIGVDFATNRTKIYLKWT